MYKDCFFCCFSSSVVVHRV